MSELERQPARGVFTYAVGCLEHQAAELAESLDVALVPVEAFTGGSSLRKRLQRQVQRMLGESLTPVVSSIEQAALVEIEREIAREFPFYFDDARLSLMHERLGSLRLARP